MSPAEPPGGASTTITPPPSERGREGALERGLVLVHHRARRHRHAVGAEGARHREPGGIVAPAISATPTVTMRTPIIRHPERRGRP